MSLEITDEAIKIFLSQCVETNDIQDFGYLLIPDDARLNDEAMCVLKKKFKDFVEAG